MGKGKALVAASSLVIGSLLLAACAPAENTDPSASTTAPAGNEPTSVTVMWNQPLYALNQQTEDANAVANANIVYLIGDTFAAYDGELNIVAYPDYGTYELLSEEPLTVKFTLSDKAVWSDGVPVNAADTLLAWASQSGKFNTITGTEAKDKDGAFVQQTGENVYFSAAGTTGFELVDSFEVSDDLKSVTFVYGVQYPDWEQIVPDFGRGLPAHIVYKRATGGATAGIDEAKALVKAFEDKDNATIAKIANVWNFDWATVTSMPTDPDLLVANGPYQLSAYEKGQYLTLKARPEYQGSHKAPFDLFTFRYTEDPMAAVQALQNGEVSYINPQATADVLAALQALGSAVGINNGLGGTYEHIDLTFDNAGPFDPATYGGDADKAKAAREAFLLTIPRQDIIDKIIKPLNPNAEIRQAFSVVPGAPWYDDVVAANGQVEKYPSVVDIDAAKAKLAEAGVTTLDVRFMYGKSNVRRQQEYQLIKESAALAGINVIDAGSDDWGNKLGDRTYDASLFGWQTTSLAVTEPKANFFSTGGNNFGGFGNAEVDALYTELDSTIDEARQLEIVIGVEKLLVSEAFGTTIFQFPEISAYSSDLKNASTISMMPTIFWNFWEWELA
ncbi:MAG: ABC transporter substrate-binding protein [Propionibacteriaceae bacterium]|jgi:peptide/nickel transport system substrate-binding protein|nr:ABC transporter substrate-binding protein [Propionibacteriaceae bacterium]